MRSNPTKALRGSPSLVCAAEVYKSDQNYTNISIKTINLTCALSSTVIETRIL